jgi:hypothetical protein
MSSSDKKSYLRPYDFHKLIWVYQFFSEDAEHEEEFSVECDCKELVNDPMDDSFFMEETDKNLNLSVIQEGEEDET